MYVSTFSVLTQLSDGSSIAFFGPRINTHLMRGEEDSTFAA
jgi:hypothetical protein